MTNQMTYDALLMKAHGYMQEAAMLRAQIEALQDLAVHAYIFCGVHDAPEKWLDVMFAGANGDDFTTEGLLPYTPPADPLVEWANRPLVYTSEVGEIKEFKIHTAQPQGDASPEQPRCECPHGDALEPLENHGLNCPVRVADPQVSGGVEVNEEMVKRFKSAYETAREADDTQDAALRDGLEAALSTPQARPDGGAADYTDIANRAQEITGRSVWPSTVKAILDCVHPTSAPDVARLVELLNAIDADVLAAEQIGERVTHDDIRTCVSELRAAAQQEGGK